MTFKSKNFFSLSLRWYGGCLKNIAQKFNFTSYPGNLARLKWRCARPCQHSPAPTADATSWQCLKVEQVFAFLKVHHNKWSHDSNSYGHVWIQLALLRFYSSPLAFCFFLIFVEFVSQDMTMTQKRRCASKHSRCQMASSAETRTFSNGWKPDLLLHCGIMYQDKDHHGKYAVCPWTVKAVLVIH